MKTSSHTITIKLPNLGITDKINAKLEAARKAKAKREAEALSRQAEALLNIVNTLTNTNNTNNS